MKTPHMEVLEFGYFDSQVRFSGIPRSKERRVDSYEIEFYVESFPRNSILNGKKIPFRAGRVIIAKPGDTRYSELPFSCYCIHILTGDSKICAFLNTLPTMFFTVFPEKYLTLFQELLKIEDMAQPMKTFSLQSVAFQILGLLALESPNEGMEEYPVKNREVLLSARSFIDEHFRENIRLSDIARHVHLSPNYFHRIFTEYFHTTPGKYLEKKRIEDAKIRLATSDDSVSQIASLSGFSSQSYFTTRFTEVTEMTPLAYRKKSRSHGSV